MNAKPRIAIHKFASCDGCQLAFLNLGETLLELTALVDIAHFAEAGPVDPQARVDVAFVEGSICMQEDIARIQQVRANSRWLVTIGACATAGGLQALRNLTDSQGWLAAVYARPDEIAALADSTPIKAHVKVDFELWGCPVNARQVLAALRALLNGVTPSDDNEKLCMDCKRRQIVCTLVTRGAACLGAVTRSGCGALCPRFGRDCYACYGPAENLNVPALRRRLSGLGLLPDAIDRRFQSFNAAAPEFVAAAGKPAHD